LPNIIVIGSRSLSELDEESEHEDVSPIITSPDWSGEKSSLTSNVGHSLKPPAIVFLIFERLYSFLSFFLIKTEL
jgi:hypothetical protein